MNADGTNAEIIGNNYRNSYEQSITSFGDVFQNDNDDPPACRVSFVMEYANFGFSSNDGQRSWQADRRPGQTTPVAEWRQDDPGMTPFGDVYGGGSPTGNAFYENGALGAGWEGTFFAAEAGRNEVFSYQPKPSGATFALDRKIFLTSNKEQKYAGSDFLGGGNSVTSAVATLFRPSDVTVGPDGALYVSDWIDARVGGHQDLDNGTTGAIYRVAPKGFVSRPPAFDAGTIEGQITALRSPAINVRAIGFNGLKARGAAAVGPVAALLNDPNRFIRARALYLLYQLGPEGRKRAGSPESQTDPAMRIAAYRAMRRAGLDVLPIAAKLATDKDPGVRREVALSLRDQPAETSLDLLVELARGYDGQDRTYLEALGTGATKKEAALYDRLRAGLGSSADPVAWSPTFVRLAWRLHVPAAVPDLLTRARSATLSAADRKLALDTIAFVEDPAASKAMLALAAPDSPLKEQATWWLLNRMSNTWSEHGLRPTLKTAGIYDPDAIVLREATVPPRAAGPADAVRRRDRADERRCREGQGHRGAVRDVPPDRRRRRRGRTGARRLGPRQVRRRDRDRHRQPERRDRARLRRVGAAHDRGPDDPGRAIKQGDPLMVRSMGGITQIVPLNRVGSRRRLPGSLMMSAAQQGLTEQDVADLVAFLGRN